MQGQKLKGVVRAQVVRLPPSATENAFNVGLPKHNLLQPVVTLVFLMDSPVEVGRLTVGEMVEVDLVDVVQRTPHVTIESRSAEMVEVVFGTRPPRVERRAGLPGVEGGDPAEVRNPPKPSQAWTACFVR